MQRNSAFFYILILIYAFFFSAGAQAGYLGDLFPKLEWGYSGNADYYRWEERLPDNSVLLTESGPRLGAGLYLNNLRHAAPGPLLDYSFNVYIGQTRYTGHSQDGLGNFNEAKTSTDYRWTNTELLIGGRRKQSSLHIDGLIGAGLDYWSRSINSTWDSAGNYATGYTEIYRVVALKAAGGSRIPLRHGSLGLRLGIKYPILTKEWVAGQSIVLEPGKRPSFFGKLDLTGLLPFLKKSSTASMYYESFHFSASKPDPATLMYQPESIMHMLGIKIDY